MDKLVYLCYTIIATYLNTTDPSLCLVKAQTLICHTWIGMRCVAAEIGAVFFVRRLRSAHFLIITEANIMKKRTGVLVALVGFLIILGTVVSASGHDDIQCISGDADNITYYKALLHGSIIDESNSCAEYGFEIWADNTTKQEKAAGTGMPVSEFTLDVICLDDNKYYYRAYCKDSSGYKYYGEQKSFKTDKREKNESVHINYDIAVEDPNNIDIKETPNKFLLNDLICNRKDNLQLIAGDNFDGINYVAPSGDQNIFINQFFINHYYDDALFRMELNMFDALIYNRDDFIYSAAATIILPDKIAYAFGSDADKSAMMSYINDPTIKRYQGAINKILSGNYIST